ncbi:hypothetical protein ACRE_035490 [Hapsidospora chrysogenum ATCC 11550]|uniref:Uncharacterized protein n=1 Tax=Hapsidospora chrysogenum (strain ATCC 11550 / CBS 779.69 / DSM 880 / IAM 14645 / JCM 23072 / IMI 49137) TaxID=857340 RepID=A0A086T8H8_HAPC1|nr:hypothetical protein ACRE_035490 [Hapsidospora chrysogenum ATCC 11550]
MHCRQYRIYTEALAKWPKQALRPDYQLQDVIRPGIEARYKDYKPSMEAEELFKARSLQVLQQNRFMDRAADSNGQYKLKGPMLEPDSQPTYFEDLLREIEEAPKRTWLERVGKRLSGMIRLQ